MKEFKPISLPENQKQQKKLIRISEEIQDLEPFPIHIFPSVVQDYINGCTECLNLVPDFMGVSVLSAVASMIGNSYQIKVKEGWVERPILWIAVVGYSGVRKTPSLKMIIDPLQRIDKRLYQNYCEKKEQYEIEKELGGASRPVPEQLIVGDTTIEALFPILENNPNGVLYYRDELIGWINDLTRYSKGSAEQHWLSMYSNQSIRLNRKTTEDNLRIENPFVNVLGGIQPDVLTKLFEDERGVNGFTNRIIFSYPSAIKRTISDKELDPSLKEGYNTFINRFLYMDKNPKENETVKPIILGFSEEAQQLFYDWNQSFINKKINDTGVSEVVKSTLSKLEALMPRLALVIQFIDNLGNQEFEPANVGVEATQKSILVVNYFYNHFLKVYAKVNDVGIDPVSRQKSLLQNFVSSILDGDNKEQAVKRLFSSGFINAEIARALKTSKSNINFWAKK